MDWTKFSLASLIGGVVYFFAGWIVFGLALREFTAIPAEISAVAEYPPEEFRISFMIISCLIFGALLTMIFMRWAQISTFVSGAKAGALIGVMINLAVGFSMNSMFKMNTLDQIFVNGFGDLICAGLAGGAIGWFLGRGK